MTAALRLVRRFRQDPGAVAIVDARNRTTTYGELLAAIAQTRAAITHAGLAPGSRVILQTPPGAPFTQAAIALLLEGLVPVGIEAAQGDHVYRDRATAVNAAAVITSPVVARLQKVPAVRRRMAASGIMIPPPLALPQLATVPPPRHTPASPIAPVVDSESDALIVFTGGTTGSPRGVRLSHRAVEAYLDGLSELPEWNDLATIAADHPQQVVYGLAHGKTVYLTRPGNRRRPRHLAHLLFRDGVEGYFGSPTTWSAVLGQDLHRDATTTPRAVLVGGAPVTRPMLERFERELPSTTAVRCLYGMTEVGLIAHIDGADKLARLRAGADGDPVGALVAGCQAAVVDGELEVSTPARFSGYLDDADAPAAAAFATGDLATLAGDELVLLGRKKDMIVSQGVNLYAGQFEPRLLTLDHNGQRAFDDVALIRGPADELGDERFVLCYTSPTPIDEATALTLVSTMLPTGHAPSAAMRFSELPSSGRQGKTDRRALEVAAASRVETSTPSRRLVDFQQANLALLKTTVPPGAKRLAITQLATRNLRRVHRQSDNAPHPSRWPTPAPVFILGHQRSGTTALHRALCRRPDTEAFTLLDMVAPHELGWRLLRPAARIARTLEQRMPHHGRGRMGRIASLHRLGLTEPEEEEWLFAALGLSGFVPAAFPETLGSHDFDQLRDRAAWPDGVADDLVDTYARILEAWRDHRRVGPTIRHVAKNPAFGPIAHRLAARFPDATFLVMVREPTPAITSRLDLYEAIHGRKLTPSEVEVVVTDSIRQMEGLATNLAQLPPDRTGCYSFEQFSLDPMSVIDQASVLARLAPIERRSQPATKPRTTDPGRYGLDPSWIDSQVPQFAELVRDVGAEAVSFRRTA